MIYNGKAKIENTAEQLVITIPAFRGFGLIILYLLFIFFMGYFISQIVTLYFRDSVSFSMPLLLIFTLATLVYIILFFWDLLGKEKIEIEGRELIFSKTILNIGYKKRMELNEVKNFRTQKLFAYRWGLLFYNSINIKRGKIHFDYGLRTYGFGNAVDEAEANYLVELINERLNKVKNV
jgi:hypothetical protein